MWTILFFWQPPYPFFKTSATPLLVPVLTLILYSIFYYKPEQNQGPLSGIWFSHTNQHTVFRGLQGTPEYKVCSCTIFKFFIFSV